MFPNALPHSRPTRSRREFIRDAFCGFGGLALAALLDQERARAAPADPLAPKPPHLPAKARADEALYAAKRGGRDRVRTWVADDEGVVLGV